MAIKKWLTVKYTSDSTTLLNTNYVKLASSNSVVLDSVTDSFTLTKEYQGEEAKFTIKMIKGTGKPIQVSLQRKRITAPAETDFKTVATNTFIPVSNSSNDIIIGSLLDITGLKGINYEYKILITPVPPYKLLDGNGVLIQNAHSLTPFSSNSNPITCVYGEDAAGNISNIINVSNPTASYDTTMEILDGNNKFAGILVKYSFSYTGNNRAPVFLELLNGTTVVNSTQIAGNSSNISGYLLDKTVKVGDNPSYKFRISPIGNIKISDGSTGFVSYKESTSALTNRRIHPPNGSIEYARYDTNSSGIVSLTIKPTVDDIYASNGDFNGNKIFASFSFLSSWARPMKASLIRKEGIEEKTIMSGTFSSKDGTTLDVIFNDTTAQVGTSYQYKIVLTPESGITILNNVTSTSSAPGIITSISTSLSDPFIPGYYNSFFSYPILVNYSNSVEPNSIDLTWNLTTYDTEKSFGGYVRSMDCVLGTLNSSTNSSTITGNGTTNFYAILKPDDYVYIQGDNAIRSVTAITSATTFTIDTAISVASNAQLFLLSSGYPSRGRLCQGLVYGESNTIRGIGTSFLSTFKVDDKIVIGSTEYVITGISSDTSMTVTSGPTITETNAVPYSLVFIKSASSPTFTGKNGNIVIGTNLHKNLRKGDIIVINNTSPYIVESVATDGTSVTLNTTVVESSITSTSIIYNLPKLGLGTIGTTGGTANTTLNGTGTNFLSTVKVGDYIIPVSNGVYNSAIKVTGVTSDTALTMASTAVAVGSSYIIVDGPAPTSNVNITASGSTVTGSNFNSTVKIGDKFILLVDRIERTVTAKTDTTLTIDIPFDSSVSSTSSYYISPCIPCFVPGIINASSSTTITGTATHFTSYRVGDYIVIPTVGLRKITAIASDTSMTVNSAVTVSNSLFLVLLSGNYKKLLDNGFDDITSLSNKALAGGIVLGDNTIYDANTIKSLGDEKGSYRFALNGLIPRLPFAVNDVYNDRPFTKISELIEATGKEIAEWTFEIQRGITADSYRDLLPAGADLIIDDTKVNDESSDYSPETVAKDFTVIYRGQGLKTTISIENTLDLSNLYFAGTLLIKWSNNSVIKAKSVGTKVLKGDAPVAGIYMTKLSSTKEK